MPCALLDKLFGNICVIHLCGCSCSEAVVCFTASKPALSHISLTILDRVCFPTGTALNHGLSGVYFSRCLT